MYPLVSEHFLDQLYVSHCTYVIVHTVDLLLVFPSTIGNITLGFAFPALLDSSSFFFKYTAFEPLFEIDRLKRFWDLAKWEIEARGKGESREISMEPIHNIAGQARIHPIIAIGGCNTLTRKHVNT